MALQHSQAKSSDLERRKFVRLRIRDDLNIAPQRYEGRTFYVVKDPVSLRYYRFKEQEYFLLQMMDGTHSLDQAQKAFEKRFRPERLTLEDLEQFGQQLLTAGLAQNETPNAGQQLYDRFKKRRRSEFWQKYTNILYIKAPLFDPERVLNWMLPKLRWMFTLWFFVASILFMLSAVLLVATHFDAFYAKLPSYQEFFSFKNMAYMWLSLGIVKVIHEFGHGLSCKAFGGEVHEMGFLFLCFSPAMYCNVSDAWTLPNKWHRIIISFAGIYVELMIAAAATFVWWNSPSSPFVNNMALSLMIVCSVSTVIFNGNPLMRYDGYYVLADWIEIPNLRDRANRYIQKLFMEHCLGIETLPEPYMETGRRILFVTFAVVSWLYKWMVTFFILTFVNNALKPYKLEIISNGLFLMSLFSMFGWPLIRMLKNLKKRGRLPDMKGPRVALTASVAAGLILVFFLVPLPVARVRDTGIVQVQPDSLDNVFVEESAFLTKLNVKEGQFVRKGTVLAEFISHDLATQREAAVAEEYIKKNLYDTYSTFIARAKDDKERESLLNGRARVKPERDEAKRVIQQLDASREKLILRAPRDGILIGLPKPDEIGKKWEKEQQPTPFCSIGDPSQLRILLPVSATDYDLVRENIKRNPTQQLQATIRIKGRGDKTFKGHVAQLPEAEAKTVPIALSNRGGGPLAIKPAKEENGQVVPLNQVFLVGIAIDNPDSAICPGAMAQVKIHNRHRTCAWWLWRTISLTFDLSLSF